MENSHHASPSWSRDNAWTQCRAMIGRVMGQNHRNMKYNYCILLLSDPGTLFFWSIFGGQFRETQKNIHPIIYIYIYGIVWPYSLVHFQCKCALPAYIKPCNYQSLSACFKNNTFFLERSAKFLPLQRHHFGLLEWQHELLNSSW